MIHRHQPQPPHLSQRLPTFSQTCAPAEVVSSGGDVLAPNSVDLKPDVRAVILIPTRNRPDDLQRTVRRVVPMLGPGTQLVIVDDASTDEKQVTLLEDLEKTHERASVVRLPVKAGCTGARRAVLLDLPCEYVIMLDDDSHFTSSPAGLVDQIIRRFEQEPELAIQAFPVYVPAADGRFVEESGPIADRQIVSWFVNCGCAIRTSAYRDIGGYRPEFLSPYGEEIDLSLRIMEAGWTIRRFSQPEVLHYRSRTSRDSAQNVRGWSLNYLRLAWWYHPAWFALIYSACHLARQMSRELRTCRSVRGTFGGLADFARECRTGIERRPIDAQTLKVAYGLRRSSVLHVDTLPALGDRSWARVLVDILTHRP